MLKTFLKEKKRKTNIIIELSASTKRVRTLLINIINEYRIDIFCIYFKIPKEVCLHLNYLRKFKEINKSKRNDSVCPKLILSYYKQFENISEKEGFKQILNIERIEISEKKNDKHYFFLKYF